MRASYDKILLCLGVLLLALGATFYVLNLSKVPNEPERLGQPSLNEYQKIPVSSFTKDVTNWPNAKEQAPGELYDIFTPPAIWIDDDGTFIFVSPANEPEPFGVYLASLEQEAYRLQLEGYVEGSLSEPSKSLLLLYDEEKKEQLRVRVGESDADTGFSVLKFTIDRVKSNGGGVKKLAVATLRDHRNGRRIYLTHGERLLKKNATVVFKSLQDQQFEARINRPTPYPFENSLGKYVLEKINLEESSVTVRKIEEDADESKTKELFLNFTDASEEVSSEHLEAPNKDSNEFEFEF